MARTADRERGAVVDLVGSLLLVVALLLAVIPAAALAADGTEPDAAQGEAAQPEAAQVDTAYRATMSPGAVSPTGASNDVVVSLEQDTGAGWEPVAAGTTADVSATDTSLVVEDQCMTGTGDDAATPAVESNVCRITVQSDVPAILTLAVQQVTAPDAPPTAVDSADAASTHEWVEVSVAIEVDALVRVRDEHPVTVQGTVFAADDHISPLPDGTIVEVGWDGPAGSTIAGAADAASCTIDAGVCYLDLLSTTAGTGVATLSRVTFPWAGTEVEIELDAEAGVRDPSTSPGSATVTWVAFRGELGPDGRGEVGDAHTMTARFAYTTDGATWLPVPDGSTATYDVSGRVGTVTDDGCGSLVGASCRIRLVSDAAGTARVTLASLSVFVPWVGGRAAPPGGGNGPGGGPGGPIVVGAERQGVSLTVRLRDGAPGIQDDAAAAPRSAAMTWVSTQAAIGVELRPVVGDTLADGDLTYARDFDGTGLPGLEWSPSSTEDKVAVFEYVLTNLGDATLTEVALFDDRIGVILDGTEGVTLAAGESTTLRAAEVFTMLQAVEVLVVRTAAVTALADGVEVRDEDTTAIRLQAVLGSVIVREPTDGTVTGDDESDGLANGPDAAGGVDGPDELAATGLGDAGLLLPTSLGLLLAGLLVLRLERRRPRTD